MGPLAVLIVLIGHSVRAADPPKKPLLQTATLPGDSNVRKRLDTVRDYFADQRWSEAIDILHEVAQTNGRSLVLAQEGQAGGSAVYLNVASRCNVLLSQMPKEGLVAYRRKVDPQAKRWFENWQRTRDDTELQRLVRQAYLSSLGDDALWALGESAWDREDFSSARLYWSQLAPLTEEARAADLPTVLRYPDSDSDPAAVLARLVLCSIMEGHREQAVEQQQRFAELYPQTEGRLAGRQGRFAELLDQILNESAKWDATTDKAEVATFGLAPERSRILPSVVDVGAPRWHRPLTPNRLPQPERLRLALDRGPLSTHPVVFQDIVFVNDADAIWAWNLLTGEPAWPTERGTAQIYPSVPEDFAPIPQMPCVGVPFFTMTISDGRLLARMGSPVTSAADNEHQDLASNLVCLDLAQEQGKLLWKLDAHELVADAKRPWRFEGSPLVVSGRAYIVLSRRRPQMEFSVACLDANSGQLLWHQTTASSRSGVQDHQNRISHLLLTYGAGKLYLSTDAGAIVALDAKDGRPEWAVSYQSRPPENAEDQSDQFQQGLVPALFHEGLLFVAPNDCDRLFCIEADAGRVRWQLKQPQSLMQPRHERWRHLLGVVPGGNSGRLIVSGHSLGAIDIHTSRLVWPLRWPNVSSHSMESGYGRGVLAGDVIYWPQREAILIIDARTGEPQRNVPLNTPDSAEIGGNLTIAGGMLLVAQPDRLVAYGEYSLLKERLHRDLSSRPNDPSLLLRLAEIEAAAGNLPEAIAAVRGALQFLNDQTSQDRSRPDKTARLLSELLRRSSVQKQIEGQVDAAVECLTEALSLVSDPSDKVSLLFELAQVELRRQRPADAVDYWQQVLNDERWRVAVRLEQASVASPAGVSSPPTDGRQVGEPQINKGKVRQGGNHAISVDPRILDRFSLTENQRQEVTQALKELEAALAMMANDSVPLTAAQALQRMQMSRPVRRVLEAILAAAREPGDSLPRSAVESDRQPFGVQREMTAAEEATAAISQAIQQYGRAVYANIERRALREIAAAREARSPEELHRVLQRFPHAEATQRAWFELASLHRETGTRHAAFPIYAQLVTTAGSPAEHVAALATWADSLEAAGYWRAARDVWQQLDSPNFARETVELDGASQQANELARKRLARPEYMPYQPTASLKPMYLERAWTVNLRRGNDEGQHRVEEPAQTSSARPLVPEGDPPSRSLASVLVYETNAATNAGAGMLKCLDRHTGQTRWQQSWPVVPMWAAYAETHLLVATGDGLTAMTLEDGSSLWTSAWRDTSEADAGPSVQLRLRDHWVVVFDEHSGVRVIDTRSGRGAWSFRPRGRLQREWSCGSRQIALQTLQPAAVWLIDIAAQRRMQELAGPSEPWRQAPVLDNAESAVFVSSLRRVQCLERVSRIPANDLAAIRTPEDAEPPPPDPDGRFLRRAAEVMRVQFEGDALTLPWEPSLSTTTDRTSWTYRGGMSFAHVDPVLWTVGDRLLLTVDGTTLSQIHRETGRVQWSAGLTDLPLTDPLRQLIAAHDMAFAASRGVLRAISLSSGHRRWEQFLGSGDEQWRLAACGPLIAAWPMSPQATSSTSSQVVWCDATSGRMVQRLNLPAGSRLLDVISDDVGCLVLSDRGVFAFRSDEKRATESRPR